MMPPICHICAKDLLPNEGGLIYFSEDENDRRINKKFELPGYTGHPSNAFWFCNDHYNEAKKLSFLNKMEALKILNEKFKDII